jgi:undecaprenyl-diphosphatase
MAQERNIKVRYNLLSMFLVILLASFFLDNSVAAFAETLQTPIMDEIMGWFSNVLTVLLVLVVLTGLFLYQEKKNSYIVVLFGSFFLSILSTILLKLIVLRPRPGGIETIIISMFGNTLAIPDYSFPSMHAAAAFSVLPVLDEKFSKIKLFWIIFAVMVALSRIYLGRHYLSDVTGGILIGYIIGYFILILEDKYGLVEKALQQI